LFSSYRLTTGLKSARSSGKSA